MLEIAHIAASLLRIRVKKANSSLPREDILQPFGPLELSVTAEGERQRNNT